MLRLWVFLLWLPILKAWLMGLLGLICLFVILFVYLNFSFRILPSLWWCKVREGGITSNRNVFLFCFFNALESLMKKPEQRISASSMSYSHLQINFLKIFQESNKSCSIGLHAILLQFVLPMLSAETFTEILTPLSVILVGRGVALSCQTGSNFDYHDQK